MRGVTTTTALVYGVPAGAGGLGVQAGNAIAGLASGPGRVAALGPGRRPDWNGGGPAVDWRAAPPPVPRWAARWTPLRWRAGDLQLLADRRLGRWAAGEVHGLAPAACYAFTQVALETLRWARESGVPAVLESPNGHIRAFREVYERESRRWCGSPWRGHPSPAMVERVEEEYALAGRIRVSSEWARASLVADGVPAAKLAVLQQPIDLDRFRPPVTRPPATGPLKVCYVGSLDLRKGFVYLLRAVRRLGPGRVRLEIVGATGDRCCRRLLAREADGLDVAQAPGDPRPAFHRAELFAFPTLEDGSPFAMAEAMACGLPAVVTASCGAAEWVEPGVTGWVVPPAEVEPLAAALAAALDRRGDLPAMGLAARAATERRAGPECHAALARWLAAKELR